MKKQNVDKKINDLAPKLDRYSFRVWLHPNHKVKINSKSIRSFLKKISEAVDCFIFAGPIFVGNKDIVGLDNVALYPKYKPSDMQGMVWWNDKQAPNVQAVVLNHSHAVIYYYPKHDLLDLSVETCSKFDVEKALVLTNNFWLPKLGEMQYEFKKITKGIPYYPNDKEFV
ncbi:hypothetical protein M0R04_00855 [Candidatus Dojkabacteria bacterium]|jgi:predicted amidohydrolase|nr:hypothetical protein [Candidatus Dojkabacteria bacterium]